MLGPGPNMTTYDHETQLPKTKTVSSYNTWQSAQSLEGCTVILEAWEAQKQKRLENKRLAREKREKKKEERKAQKAKEKAEAAEKASTEKSTAAKVSEGEDKAAEAKKDEK